MLAYLIVRELKIDLVLELLEIANLGSHSRFVPFGIILIKIFYLMP